jgi:hypothetical protein
MELVRVDGADVRLIRQDVARFSRMPVDQVLHTLQVLAKQPKVMYRPRQTGDDVHCQPVAVRDHL